MSLSEDSKEYMNCPLVTGLRPCMCDLPRCPICNYTKHDAQFEMDHDLCHGAIPESKPQSCIECNRNEAEKDSFYCQSCWDELDRRGYFDE